MLAGLGSRASERAGPVPCSSERPSRPTLSPEVSSTWHFIAAPCALLDKSIVQADEAGEGAAPWASSGPDPVRSSSRIRGAARRPGDPGKQPGATAKAETGELLANTACWPQLCRSELL